MAMMPYDRTAIGRCGQMMLSNVREWDRIINGQKSRFGGVVWVVCTRDWRLANKDANAAKLDFYADYKCVERAT